MPRCPDANPPTNRPADESSAECYGLDDTENGATLCADKCICAALQQVLSTALLVCEKAAKYDQV